MSARFSTLAQPVTAGVLAAVVGFASAFAIVLQGLASVGATAVQAASGLLVLCVGLGLLSIILSWRSKKPISIAWSTPGAALLIGAGVPQGGFGVAVTAFLIAGGLSVVAGLWRPLARAVEAIPMSLAGSMLAGILLELCLAPVHAVANLPNLALPIVAAWAIGWCLIRRYAVLVALVVTIGIVIATTPLPADSVDLLWPKVVFVPPVFADIVPALGIAIPLFIVTMASQNVPGIAVLKTNGYETPAGEVFVSTGFFTMLAAPFGGHAINLSAITAALCAGPEAGPDRDKRYVASVAAGVSYVVLGLFAGFAAVLMTASPPLLIQAVAGLALLSSLASALSTALAVERDRLPAIVTFVTAASGIHILGVGAAFWGLLAGAALLLLDRKVSVRL